MHVSLRRMPRLGTINLVLWLPGQGGGKGIRLFQPPLVPGSGIFLAAGIVCFNTSVLFQLYFASAPWTQVQECRATGVGGLRPFEPLATGDFAVGLNLPRRHELRFMGRTDQGWTKRLVAFVRFGV